MSHSGNPLVGKKMPLKNIIRKLAMLAIPMYASIDLLNEENR